ncbi:MAG: UDP-3-O-acyl-N-acetylglucosamine deacetylase [Desulfobacterales bacterium]|jgi:UDP-3-O-[3-hydroxymyristoyl] N-acetylglucosamine deacetylase|nr:UDP-3-O-acyl-N-acetylglucosamine deacetylase [Desulfobacterales bacterium]
MCLYYYQHTVAKPVRCAGVGMHSGKTVNLTIRPAPVNHGIRFIRTDLADTPSVAAHFNMVVDTSLATVIGYDGFIVSTIEHLMAAFSGLGIDNAVVELDSHEMPIMDGSASPFVDAIRPVGIQEQDSPRYYFSVKEPIALQDGEKSLTIYPHHSFQVTCAIEYDHPLIKHQQLSMDLSTDSFPDDVSAARTFGFIHEYEYLKRYGFAKGGSLDNVIVLDQTGILNENGLRYPDEFVRHKILDCIGDLYLLGMPILGHVVANKSGHALNNAFLKEIFSRKQSWETRSLQDEIQLKAKALAI